MTRSMSEEHNFLEKEIVKAQAALREADSKNKMFTMTTLYS